MNATPFDTSGSNMRSGGSIERARSGFSTALMRALARLGLGIAGVAALDDLY